MPQWLTLFTKPNMEHHVRDALEVKGVEVFLPIVHEYSTHYRRKAPVPFFPCYLFALVDPLSSQYVDLSWTPGLRCVVRFQSRVAWVPDDVIRRIADRVNHWDQEIAHREDNRFKPGDVVRIKSGPFAHLEAIFDRKLSREGRARVLLAVLGRLTACEIGLDSLEQIG
jgi:transcription antitermination factor NusG